MNYESSAALIVAMVGVLGGSLAYAEPPAAAAIKAVNGTVQDSVAYAALVSDNDPLAASVLGDSELADKRGGSDTHINTNTATGTVSGNVASQLTTGSNTIGESAFSSSSGIPIVIQNTGNNVLIQNSTILNLQLSNPK